MSPRFTCSLSAYQQSSRAVRAKSAGALALGATGLVAYRQRKKIQRAA